MIVFLFCEYTKIPIIGTIYLNFVTITGILLRASELLRSVSGALKLPVEKAPEDDCVTGFGDVVDAEDVCSALEGGEVGDLCAWKGFGRRDAEWLPDHALPGDAYEKPFAKNRQLR